MDWPAVQFRNATLLACTAATFGLHANRTFARNSSSDTLQVAGQESREAAYIDYSPFFQLGLGADGILGGTRWTGDGSFWSCDPGSDNSTNQ